MSDENVIPRIKSLMSSEPITVACHLSLDTAMECMSVNRIRHLPVMQANYLVGVVSERDLSLAHRVAAGHGSKITVAEIMSEQPFTCGPEQDLREVLSEMLRRKIGSAIVVEGGKVVGIFTYVDAMRELVSRL